MAAASSSTAWDVQPRAGAAEPGAAAVAEVDSCSTLATGLRERHIFQHYGGRLLIRNALSGATVCFPGVSRLENDWTVPAGRFFVRDLLGTSVYVVRPDNSTKLQEPQRISAVQTAEGEPAWPPYSLDECSVGETSKLSVRVVRVLLGEQVIKPTAIHTKSPSVSSDGTSTPQTPPTPPMLIS